MKPELNEEVFGESFDHVKAFGTDQFEKHRFKSSSLTADISIIHLGSQGFSDFIDERKEELTNLELDVVTPYSANIDREKRDSPVTFHESGDLEIGLGYADPGYNIILGNENRIKRYRYFVTWRKIDEETVAEIELFILAQDFDEEDAVELSKKIEFPADRE